ncbi:MAG: YHS domain-containing (seleno)protein [Hyphomonadaceae bacterium]|nr:YHS domain-containing (seleno)protein [Hyphomonadaceae bacterium]
MFLMKCIRTLALSIGLAVAGIAATATLSLAHADKPPVSVELFQQAAVGGYDVTSYFAGAPVVGSPQFTATHNGATYRFASAANRDRFAANPAAFAPQYGGYCAWAVAQGYTAPGRPRHWRIVDGKLYLNYDANVQSKWEKNIPGFISAANGNWPTVLRK